QSHQLGDTYIMVNITSFSLKAVRNNLVVHEMPVIVGKFQHQTPIFSDHIKYLDFNPYWNVTPSIARDEDLPALRLNPDHLVERHVRLFSSWREDAVELDSTAIDWHATSRSQMSNFKLRQDPGPWNALGRVKFVFPNHNSIYLHDTPTQNLFEQTSRSFSHGCIRVSKPLVLAAFCLEEQKGSWTIEAIDKIVATGERKVISLLPSIPIHINYQTAWVDNNEIIHFNSDIYGRDAKLIQAFDTK
ncbi:MAG: L,D-transpeptidase family protein, partial [Desulfofustis sp.]|nr:L,D-transpeptidase family protein [Desulfofustis sp.]